MKPTSFFQVVKGKSIHWDSVTLYETRQDREDCNRIDQKLQEGRMHVDETNLGEEIVHDFEKKTNKTLKWNPHE